MTPGVVEIEVQAEPPRGSAAEVFRVFLGLGLTSFGGPVAHPMAMAAAAFVTLVAWRAPAWAVVTAAGVAGYVVL